MEEKLPFCTPPRAQLRYVCWIDIMGMQSLLSRSITTAAIIISRFQKFLDMQSVKYNSDNKSDIFIHPIMDAAYITSTNGDTLIKFLEKIYRAVATNFINEGDYFQKFIIKSCIAYGLIGHGADIEDTEFTKKDTLIFGLPIIQAYKSEKKAPPFGIYIHQSARSLSDHSFPRRWHLWFSDSDSKGTPLINNLRSSLTDYFERAKKLSFCLEYSDEKIEKHEQMAGQYLNYWETVVCKSDG